MLGIVRRMPPRRQRGHDGDRRFTACYRSAGRPEGGIEPNCVMPTSCFVPSNTGANGLACGFERDLANTIRAVAMTQNL